VSARTSARRWLASSTRDRLLRELTLALEEMASRHPLALVLEDLHWSDASRLDLLAFWMRRREAARLLVLATYRPGEVVDRHPLAQVLRELAGRAGCAELTVPPLSAEEVAELVRRRLPADLGEERIAALGSTLVGRTGGWPLFLAHLLDDLERRRCGAKAPAEDFAANSSGWCPTSCRRWSSASSPTSRARPASCSRRRARSGGRPLPTCWPASSAASRWRSRRAAASWRGAASSCAPTATVPTSCCTRSTPRCSTAACRPPAGPACTRASPPSSPDATASRCRRTPPSWRCTASAAANRGRRWRTASRRRATLAARFASREVEVHARAGVALVARLPAGTARDEELVALGRGAAGEGVGVSYATAGEPEAALRAASRRVTGGAAGELRRVRELLDGAS
jgi:hypothetical protein